MTLWLKASETLWEGKIAVDTYESVLLRDAFAIWKMISNRFSCQGELPYIWFLQRVNPVSPAINAGVGRAGGGGVTVHNVLFRQVSCDRGTRPGMKIVSSNSYGEGHILFQSRVDLSHFFTLKSASRSWCTSDGPPPLHTASQPPYRSINQTPDTS